MIFLRIVEHKVARIELSLVNLQLVTPVPVFQYFQVFNAKKP